MGRYEIFDLVRSTMTVIVISYTNYETINEYDA